MAKAKKASKEDVKTTKVAPRKKNTSGKVEDGDIVSVHYTGTLDNGDVFDSSKGRDPLEFTVGQRAVIKGFEKAVLGMKPGDKKKITISPEEAYGEPRKELRQKVPRKAMGDTTPEEGMTVMIQHPQMPQPMQAKIVGVTDAEVELDLNHPLAGKTLHFDFELVAIK